MRTRLTWSGALLVLFGLLIVAVKTVDVAPIGPLGSSIGLSSINGAVRDALGASELWDKLADCLLAVAALVAIGFVASVLVQRVRRGSWNAVDPDLLLLLCLYATLAVLYVMFDMLAINYRPSAPEGVLEPSFPSSHVLAVTSVLSAAAMQVRWRLQDSRFRPVLRALCVLAIVLVSVGRLAAGAHWVTDVLGAVLLGVALALAYGAFANQDGAVGSKGSATPVGSAALVHSASSASRKGW